MPRPLRTVQPAVRDTQAVFDDHLALRLRGALEEDLLRNYAPHVVLLTNHGVFHGHDGVRRCAAILDERLPNARLHYERRLINGEIAFLEWTGAGENAAVHDGVDTFLVRDGRIIVQTVRYTVQEAAR